MNIPACLARTAVFLFVLSDAVAETCEFEDAHEDPYSKTRLTMTEDYGLREKLDRNQNFAFVRAARLSGPRFDGERRYLRVNVLIAEFADTEKQAYTLAESADIPSDLPLEITLADGETVQLRSWGARRNVRRSTVDRPNQAGNASKRFRINTWVSGQYWVDPDLVDTLSAQPAAALHITLQSGGHTVRLDAARADRIQFILGCV